MGYRCPVCGDPQADDVHLANHLAFTAIVDGGDHEAWLDEHVPDWGQLDDEGLAAQVADLAEPAEYPQVFEDTTHETDTGGKLHPHPHDHGSEDDPGKHGKQLPEEAAFGSSPEFDRETREAIERARELTRRHRSDSHDEARHAESDDETRHPGSEE